MGLLSGILEPGRDSDLRFLTDRDQQAGMAYLAGEREYRNLNFSGALEYFSQALLRDSLLVQAALKGAHAASWVHQGGLALTLSAMAIRHDSLLSSNQRAFARALSAHLHHDGAKATGILDHALVDRPDWPEARYLRGEVYFHLFPPNLRIPAAAEEEFLESLRQDPEFSLPHVHLAEIALRRGDADGASTHVAAIRKSMARGTRSPVDSARMSRTELMMACVRGELDPATWARHAKADAEQVAIAGPLLSVGGSQLECGEEAFRAILRSGPYSRPDLNPEWGALKGLSAILVATGRTREVPPLLDSIRSEGRGRVLDGLPFLSLLLGTVDAELAPLAQGVEEMAREGFGPDFAGCMGPRGSPTPWASGWRRKKRPGESVIS